ncbi:MAG: hypothetical protein H6597_04035 [Flavobacteriales bacterium]|nr:hypothetical protein [Flavobacteriales bacterium]MCB9193680.1 hypothetical protein [Flavobacteriales bacterium]
MRPHPRVLAIARVVPLLWFGLACTNDRLCAQSGVTTFGVQVKPVVPLSFFDPQVDLVGGALKGRVTLTGGFAFGMLVRTGLSRTISLETGISQIRRNYDWELWNDTAGSHAADKIRYIGYEIPVNMLVYIRLGQRTYMNTALGASIDMYPSDAVREVDLDRAFWYRNGWVQAGLAGNLGVEYRFDKAGTVYLGATYHRAFGDMAIAQLTYFTDQLVPYSIQKGISGSYLTVDLRYFFPEDRDRSHGRGDRTDR